MGSIFGVFGAAKKGAKFERIFERIFWDSGRVRRSRVGCSEAFRPLKIAWYGMVRKDGEQAKGLARPGPEGGRMTGSAWPLASDGRCVTKTEFKREEVQEEGRCTSVPRPEAGG